MQDIIEGKIRLSFHEETDTYTIACGSEVWNWDSTVSACFTAGDRSYRFRDAAVITHEPWKSGAGRGILSRYEYFGNTGISFETLVWIETATSDIRFELIPLAENNTAIGEVSWPGPMEFTADSAEWYTLLTMQQGLLIPNSWKTALEPIFFNGMLCTAANYMPWFAQVRGRQGYIALFETPFDAAVTAEHPAGGPYTHVLPRWLPSLGSLRYRRILRFHFFADCDYNTICKYYRNYVKETGRFRTLREKACSVPVEKLVGTAFVHTGIKTYVRPDSRFYNPDAPEENNALVTFASRAAQFRRYRKELGIRKLYLHLDGWGDPGYDNEHPDYLPPCKAAGGWNGMHALQEELRKDGYFFGLHDQYRDYYFAAETFDPAFAVRSEDGSIPEHANWAGGRQSYLCATQAPYYVRRNYLKLASHGIRPDGTYLDVFTCNEADECFHPMHRSDRALCLAYRRRCFEWLLSQGILTSSEEAADWALPDLVFCHYAPYHFMLKKPGAERSGIPVPLFNLVYHDCLIVPWMMEKYPDEDYMLYALLNGGAPYFVRDGAYKNTDGSFGSALLLTEQEQLERMNTVAGLHQKVAYAEMLSHHFIDSDPLRQRTVFSDGTEVEINLRDGTWQIGSSHAAD